MVQIEFLNDWRDTVYGCFHFNYVHIEFSIGRVALFYFCVEPITNRPIGHQISICILGVGISIETRK